MRKPPNKLLFWTAETGGPFFLTGEKVTVEIRRDLCYTVPKYSRRWRMTFLYILESIRNPFLDQLMLLITTLGEETAFLVAAMIMFWCVDKNRGYYMLCVGFLGTLVNHILKLTFRVPRPWVADPEFTIVEQAKEAAAGFSFPSGHTTSAVGTFGAIGYSTHNSVV